MSQITFQSAYWRFLNHQTRIGLELADKMLYHCWIGELLLVLARGLSLNACDFKDTVSTFYKNHVFLVHLGIAFIRVVTASYLFMLKFYNLMIELYTILLNVFLWAPPVEEGRAAECHLSC